MSDPRDVAAAVQAHLEPMRSELDESARLRADNAAFLEEKRRRGLDPEVKKLLEQSAESPDAPRSLQRLAQEVKAGRMTWDEVFTDRENPLAAEFRADAFETARAHFSATPVEPAVEVEPESDAEADPDQVQAEIDEAREIGREAHDDLWRRELMD